MEINEQFNCKVWGRSSQLYWCTGFSCQSVDWSQVSIYAQTSYYQSAVCAKPFTFLRAESFLESLLTFHFNFFFLSFICGKKALISILHSSIYVASCQFFKPEGIKKHRHLQCSCGPSCVCVCVCQFNRCHNQRVIIAEYIYACMCVLRALDRISALIPRIPWHTHTQIERGILSVQSVHPSWEEILWVAITLPITTLTSL